MFRPSRYIACAAVLVAGCALAVDGQPGTGGIRAISTNQASTTTTGTTTSTTVSNTLPNPQPAPNKHNDGTSFDPCRAYSAEELRSWGVNPAKVEDQGEPNGTLRGCNWKADDGWTVSQLVANRSVSDFLDQRAHPGSRPIVLNGLSGAVYFSLRGAPQAACDVVLPSQRAIVTTGVLALDTATQKLIPDPCAKAIEIATRVAPVLPQ